MNKLFALLCLAIPLAVSAAEPVVTIDNASNVYVDGVNVGAPADAIANNPALAPAIQNALASFVAAEKARADSGIISAQSQRDAAIAAKETEKQEAIAAAHAAIADTLAANDAQIATLTAERDAQSAARTTAEQQLATVTADRDGKAAQLASVTSDRDTKAARVSALESYITQIGVYMAGLRGVIAGLGGSSEAPPAAP